MKMRNTFLLAMLFGAFFVLAAQAQQEQTVSFQQGENGYEGTADTYFQVGDPVAVHGDANEWEYDGEDAGAFNVGVLRFDDIIGDGPNQIPADSEVVEAILTLTCTNSGADGLVHELLKPFSEDADFLEFTVNFEPVAGDDYAEEVIANISGPNAGDVFDVDVTASLQNWVSGGENLGWMFLPDTGTDGAGFQSSEGTEQTIPTLIISTPDGEFTFRDGLNGYDGTIDTWLNTGEELDQPQGEEPVFEWDDSDAGGSNYGLLRFDGIFGDGENQIPPGTQIDSAIIRISVTDGGGTASVHDILEGTEEEPTFFDDSTTTFDWGDTFGPRAGTDYAEEPVVAEASGDIGTHDLDVTSSIQSYSDGEENRGWVFIPVTGGGVEVIASDSGEGGTGGPPLLTVTYLGEGTAVEEFSIY